MNSTKKTTKDCTTRSTLKVIKNFHSMSWLKHDSSSNKPPRMDDKDGKLLSAKKTNEDYFSGTREEKKSKKKKEKKTKNVLTMGDLEGLMVTNNRKFSTTVAISDSVKVSSKLVPNVTEVTKNFPASNVTAATNTTWSTPDSTVDKLFPNVQSVIINRLEEEEMLSQAIAESIAMLQLKEFNKPSLEKSNRWDALYGGNDDNDDGWDNVRRNLPKVDSTEDGSSSLNGQRYDDNNNSSKPGTLQNKEKELSNIAKRVEKLDFSFKTPAEISEEESESPRSQKLVSFDESAVPKVTCTEPKDVESRDVTVHYTKESNIDKFDRVDGYSERRLFMGKGARVKEQEYIKNKGKNRKLEIDSAGAEIVENVEGFRNSSRNYSDKAKEQRIFPHYEKKVCNETKVAPCEVNIQIRNVKSKDLHTPEEELDSVGRCLVPTFVRDDNCSLTFPTADFLCTESIPTIPNMEYQSAACQNLLLTGMPITEVIRDAKNSQENHFSVDTWNDTTMQSQTFDNTQGIRSEIITGDDQIDWNIAINRLPNCDYQRTTSDFVDWAEILRMFQNMEHKYSDSPGQIGVEGLTYRDVDRSSNALNFMAREVNLSYDKSNDDVESRTANYKVASHVRLHNESKPHQINHAPPGLIRKPDLPSGFTRHEYNWRTNPENGNRADKSFVSSQCAKNDEYGRGKGCDREYRDNDYFTASGVYRRSDMRNSSKMEQSFHRSQLNADERGQASDVPKNRKVPYPILGASQKVNEIEPRTPANWRYNVDLINPVQTPTNFSPNYHTQMVENFNNLLTNFQQSPPTNHVQLPLYSFPRHAIDENENENFVRQERTPIFESQIHRRSMFDYNSNANCSSRFGVNSRGFEEHEVTDIVHKGKDYGRLTRNDSL